VEDHQREDHRAHRGRGQKRTRHRDARGQALLRAAEDGGDLVFFGEAEGAAGEGRRREHQREQAREQEREHDEGAGRDLVPEPVGDRLAERPVDDEEDRAAIDPAEDFSVARQEAEQTAPAEVADDERDEELKDQDEGAVAVDGQCG
jgi:hypothetical protein